MPTYLQRFNIKLEEAMTMEVEQNIRLWIVFGPHVKVEEISKIAYYGIQTYVMMRENARFLVYVYWKTKKERKSYIKEDGEVFLDFGEESEEHVKIVAEISTLEELKNKFPDLFELEGILYAFSE